MLESCAVYSEWVIKYSIRLGDFDDMLFAGRWSKRR